MIFANNIIALRHQTQMLSCPSDLFPASSSVLAGPADMATPAHDAGPALALHFKFQF